MYVFLLVFLWLPYKRPRCVMFIYLCTCAWFFQGSYLSVFFLCQFSVIVLVFVVVRVVCCVYGVVDYLTMFPIW